MKSTLLLFFIFFFTSLSYSQDYLTTIAEKSCQCVEKVSDTLEAKSYNMQLGICMIEAAMPYKKQIKKDYDVNMDNIGNEGEKLGGIIGVKMASVCPTAMLKIAERSKQSGKDEEEKPSENNITGIVSKIENDLFVTFTLKTETGKSVKFYWLNFINAEMDLPTKYNTLLGKTINVNYTSMDFFDPKIEEYRQFNIISKIRIVQ
jgi:hypothetical protein